MNEKILFTILGILFIFIATSIGALTVLFFKNGIKEKWYKFILGFSSGVMFAAAIWSLIIKAFSYTFTNNIIKYFLVVIGIIFGTFFIISLDMIIPKYILKSNKNLSKVSKMFIAVTLHNIPEGLVVGISFGLALNSSDKSLLYSALLLSFGIGFQNILEGAALSIPYLNLTLNKKKSVFYGILSGIVEPIFACFGVLLVFNLNYITPFLLSFAAGSMIYVVIEEMIPDARLNINYIGSIGFILGFIIMMMLDIIL